MSQNWRDWPVPDHSNAETLEQVAEQFEYFDDDVLVNTYFKSGTTLTQEIVYSLIFGVDAAKTEGLHNRCPFIDFGMAEPQSGQRPIDWAVKTPRPRVLKTHLPAPFHMRHLEKTDAKGPKVLVVMRNPKDTMVSAYHHLTSSKIHAENAPKTFSEVWRMLATGSRSSDSLQHNYFDFTLSWWSMRDHPRVRVYFYEDMVARKAEAVRSIAQFLGLDRTEEQVQAVVDHTSFRAMRENPMVNPTIPQVMKAFWLNDFNFMRKGQVGDWKNHFTVAENELMDRLIQEHLEPVGLKFVYE